MLARSAWQACRRICVCQSGLSSSRPACGRALHLSQTRYIGQGQAGSSIQMMVERPATYQSHDANKEARQRQEELEQANINPYPRLQHPERAAPRTITQLIEAARGFTADEAFQNVGHLLPGNVAGRITSIRLSGKKLAFFDLKTDTASLQLMLNYTGLQEPRPTLEDFREHCRLLRRGDHISVEARPHLTNEKQFALQAIRMPILQSPCLQRFPVFHHAQQAQIDSEAHVERHVEMMTSDQVIDTIRCRHQVLDDIRKFFSIRDFVEVQTPILTANAGGAIARPFETSATEFLDRKLALRIAPELWLKRLIIGGLTRIFEMGPSFRNEGLDKTHNPEFSTCEFYAAYWNLQQLKSATEEMLTSLVRSPKLTVKSEAKKLFATQSHAFKVIDFIPALNQALGIELPNLASSSARTDLKEIFQERKISLPERPTLPRLLDGLSSHYLEPRCHGPTWIENIPECLSPLAKSFLHPTAPNDQIVAARAELFIQGREYVNCYEEENDPAEQRRKFHDQQKYALDLDSAEVDPETMQVDEEYLRALEWGLPPTGGWGMGIDRLLMLLLGKDKIADVLTFGNLRAVTRRAER